MSRNEEKDEQRNNNAAAQQQQDISAVAAAHPSNNAPVARLPHASLPPPPRKGPHHAHGPLQPPPPMYHPQEQQQQQAFTFSSMFGLPMMSSTTASTPAATAHHPSLVTSPQIQTLFGGNTAFSLPQGGAANKGPSTTKKTTTQRGKKKRGRSKRSRASGTNNNNTIHSKNNKKKKTPSLQILDDDPKRLVNPLVDVPFVDSNVSGERSIPPQASDLLLTHVSLPYCKPDTFPLSYHARLLGFDVPPLHFNHGRTSVELNVASLSLLKEKDGMLQIPPLGTWFAQTHKNNSNGGLEFVDPFYQTLLHPTVLPALTPTNTIPKMTRELQREVLQELELEEFNDGISTTAFPEGRFTVSCHNVTCVYDLAWFPIVSGKESELVLHVHHLRVSENDHEKVKEEHVLAVVCLVLQHARVSHVWYGVWQHVPVEFSKMLETYFGMKVVEFAPTPHHATNLESTTALAKSLYQAAATMVTSPVASPTKEASDTATTTAETLGESHLLSSTNVSLLCDLHFSSTRYAALLFRQQRQDSSPKALPLFETRQRMLVRLPTVEQATDVMAAATNKPGRPRKFNIGNAKEAIRNTLFGVRVTKTTTSDEDTSAAAALKLEVLNEDGPVVKKPPPSTATTPETAVAALPTTTPATTGDSNTSTDAPNPLMAAKTTVASLPAGTAAPAGGSTPGPAAAASLPSGDPATASLPAGTPATASSLPTSASATPKTTAVPHATPPSWDVLKVFDQVVPGTVTQEAADDEILQELKAKQSELVALEGGMENKVRSLLQQVVDVRMDYEKNAEKREGERQMLKAYDKILDRRKEIDTAWQKQLEQDMDAVCEICRDGEVTPDNQILFCEACNVAVHQMCYGIEKVPEGDYYCIACRYLDRDKMSKALSARGGQVKRVAPAPLPICCELCPRKQGAFVRCATPGGNANPGTSKWVHVVCAKWQGLNFEPLGQTDVVEDVQELKKSFLRAGHSCILCRGRRGAYVQCRHEDCKSWMHVTCARESGLCEVSHGENCHGDVETNPWTLLCPEHSMIDPQTVQDQVSIEQLVRSAEEFPPEPYLERIKARPKKVFIKMNGKERREFLKDPEYEKQLLDEISKKLHGVHCEVCHQFEDDGKNLFKCSGCNVVFCQSCVLPDDVDPDEKEYRCPACKYVDEKEREGKEYEVPQCTMCFQKGGWLREAYAEPVNRKAYWRNNPEEFEKTLFAKDLWCHAICTMWHPKVTARKDGTVNCTPIIMSNGQGHILSTVRCALCGDNRKMKVSCSEEGCRCWGQRRGAYSFHVTCAREAGLEIRDKADEKNRYYFDTKCFRHGGEDFAFRARMEDLIEVERRRYGKRFEKAESSFMSLAHASRLYNKAIIVMKMLGWAWRWAEWWVEFGDNWEPLLEPGEREEDMTKEELKIVDTTRESRCEAARKCRLAPFGAALRNREYDNEDGDDFVALDRALRAVLHTPQLVGPLEENEIDFFAEWLARVYRSKSRLLGFGDDKMPIHDHVWTLHRDDNSPKYLLGARRLPGKQELPEGEVFETDFHDVDDFMKPEMFEDGSLVTEESLQRRKRTRPDDEEVKDSPSPQKMSRRGKKSQYGSLEEDTEAPSEVDPSLGTLVTLTAIFTEATEDDSQEDSNEDAPVTRTELLPSPIQAVILDWSEDTDSREREAADHSEKPVEKKGGKKKRGGWPKGKKRAPKPVADEEPKSEAPPKRKRGGWPKGRKRGRKRKKSSPEVSEESAIAASDDESYKEVMPVPKRRGRPPKSRPVMDEQSVDEEEFVEDAKPAPKKRRGRPPKSEVAVKKEPTEDILEEDMPVPKMRRGRSAKGSTALDAPSTRSALQADEVDGTAVADDDSGANEQSSEDEEEGSDSVVENAVSSDDDIAVAVYVQRGREAKGEATSVLARSSEQQGESSATSSDSEKELPQSEMTRRQRGRRQGKNNAVREMWGAN